jgi:Flp pilus assembly protein TadG
VISSRLPKGGLSMSNSPCLSRRARRGAAAVEFALLLPFLCFVFIATIDFCRVFYYSLTVSNCARNGAIYGSTDWSHALNASGIQAASKADAGNLNLQLLTVTSRPIWTEGGSNPTDPSSVAVTVNYPFTTITQYPGIPKQTNLSRTVRMSVLPPTPNFN